MRIRGILIALVLTCTWTTALGSELPVSSASAGSDGKVSVALWSASRSDRLAPRLGEAVPVPLAKPLMRRQPPREAICRMIETAAREHEIPVRFLTRLIWQESRFRIGAVSHAGARGIAQFMPATAAERDLKDPFDPKQALLAAASLLSSLKQRFGNLGLAAAAYNAGPKRVSDWLRKRRRLPEETRNYVKAITGRPARSWAGASKKSDLDFVAGDGADEGCVSSVVAMAGEG